MDSYPRQPEITHPNGTQTYPNPTGNYPRDQILLAHWYHAIIGLTKKI